MKKGFKRVLSLGLVATMSIALLAGCGTKSTGNEGNTDNGGDDANTFVIGGLGPLTGEAASYGISVKQGAEVAIEEINNAGGVKVGGKTYTFKLNFADDEASGETASSAYNSLMDSGIDALLGTVTSGAGLAIAAETSEDGIFQITPSGSAKELTDFPNQFRLCFTDPLQGETMAQFAISELGYKKIAILYNNSDEYSKGVMDAFVTEAEKLGGAIVANEAFAKGAVDFTTQLTKIKNTDAEVIFVPAYYQDAAYITTQAAELGMDLPYLGSDGWDGVIANVVDTAVLENAIFLSPFFSSDDSDLVKTFVKTYEEKYKSTPDQFAADGYDTVFVMKAALEKAGSTDSAALIKAMTEISVTGVTGDLTFNENGEPNKGAKFIEIIGGEYTAKK
jgi:branched-chain amino acid transport system substrate-binding protein